MDLPQRLQLVIDGDAPLAPTQAMDPDEELLAHAGILSSTNAVLKDLKGRGLLQEMLAAKQSGESSAGGGLNAAAGARRRPPWAPAPHGGMQRQASLQRVDESDSPSSHGSKTGARGEAPRFPHDALEGGAAEAQRLERIHTMRSYEEVDLPLERAQTMLLDKIGTEGWKVVVAGHSLGAA